jgi:16S rRNA (cytosine967-C5)-methyltransferase
MSLLMSQARAFPELSIEPLDISGLSPQDAALAKAIYHAVLRRWLTLEHIIASLASRPTRSIDAPVRASLLAGLAQLLLLDRVPAHAAVNETVSWARRAAGEPGSKFVNAIMRSCVRQTFDENPSGGPPTRRERDTWTGERDELPLPDGRAVVVPFALFPEDPIACLAAQTSHHEKLVKRWAGTLGDEECRAVCLHNTIVAPAVLNVDHRRGDLPERCFPHSEPGAAIFGGAVEALDELLTQRPDLWVQDSASMRAVRSCRGLNPSLVIDLCAGQGTKTRQLAATFPNARIIASDPDEARAKSLRLVTAQYPNVTVVEPGAVARAAGAGADLVLLDVPCSNSGVFARRLEARYRWNPDMLARLTATQREILAAGCGLVRIGEHVLYTTCSIEPEENRSQALWACGGALPLKLEREEQTPPAGLPGQGPDAYRDGSYHALLERTG